MAYPFLRWAGSKRKLLPHLESFWNGTHKRYVEPFAGSACLFFSLRPDHALLGDINGELIGVYKTLRAETKAVHETMSMLPVDEHAYYGVRATPPAELDAVEQAARFI
jgi:DNA adenine methylase